MNRQILLAVFFCLFLNWVARAQPLVYSFSGSKRLVEYKSDVVDMLLVKENGQAIERFHAEGCFESHVCCKPADKTNLEILRSDENELTTAGFSID
jgi:hypothetical protein